MFVYNTQVIKNHGSIIQRLLKIFYKICLEVLWVHKLANSTKTIHYAQNILF